MPQPSKLPIQRLHTHHRPVPGWISRLGCALAMVMVAMLLMGQAAHAADPRQVDMDMRPVPVGRTVSDLPPDWKHGVFMEIHVRAYQDSNGDLRGLISRLDYLKDLGITGLWLMPVMESQDKDHGYAVVDYRRIDSDYGTLADMDELLKQAHARGIGIVLDYLINHSAADHPLFEASSASKTGPYRDWYIWADKPPQGWKIYNQNPWYEMDSGAYFAGFWNQMPDFNLRNPKVLAWHADNLRYWLNRGVDGFRFDATGNLIENGPDAWENQPENHAVMRQLRAVVMAYDNRWMVCEAPPAPIDFAASCGASFAFGQQANVIGAAAGDDSSIEDTAAYFKTAPLTMATMASNHDQFAGERLWNQLDGNLTQQRLAAATYLLLPGTPFVYYGEEIGMADAPTLKGDPKLRTPMSWTGDRRTAGFTTATEPFRELSANAATQNVAAELARPDGLRAHYKAVIALRKSRASLMRGSYLAPTAVKQTLSFQRQAGDDHTLVVFNYGKKPATVALADLPAGAQLLPIWPVQSVSTAALRADAAGKLDLEMAPQSFWVYDIKPGR